MSRDWEKWHRFEWSERLLDLHFSRSHGRSAAVYFIDASEDALLSCARAPAGSGERVRERFIGVISKSASDSSPWDKCKRTCPKEWYAYLVAVCSVFIDSEQIDERSYIEPLKDTLGPSFTNGLEHLPDLWLALQAWLESRPTEYRALHIPEADGWKRIGQTKKLAFPSKSDQRKIADALREANLSDDPPLGMTLDVMRKIATSLSEPTQQSLSRFELLVASNEGAETLHDTALWSAVLSASRASYQQDELQSGKFGLTVEVEEDEAASITLVASDLPTESQPWFEPMAGHDPWTHYTTSHEIVGRALGGDSSVGRVGQLARSGFIPLRDSGYWELQPRGEDEIADTALVTDIRLAEIHKTQSSSLDVFPVFGHAGWFLVHGVAPARVVSDQEVVRPTPRNLRFKGGVKLAKNKYLNTHLALPEIGARWAEAVELVSPEGRSFPLVDANGKWKLSDLPNSVHGKCTLTATSETSTTTQTLEFVQVVASSKPKAPPTPDRWAIDGNGTSTRWDAARYGDTLETIESDETILLSNQVGIGAEGKTEATWAVAELGSEATIRLLRPEGYEPSARSGVKRDERNWRKLLESRPFNDQTAAALELVRSQFRNQSSLPIAEGPSTPTFSARRRSIDAPAAGHLEATLAGRLQSASTMRVGEVVSYIRASTGLGQHDKLVWEYLWDLVEAGVVDVAADLHWSGRVVIGIAPKLVVHKTPFGVSAVLGGLGTDLLREDLEAGATAVGASISAVSSSSPVVPKTLVLRAESEPIIRAISNSTRIPVVYLQASPSSPPPLTDLQRGEPEKYESHGHPFSFDSAPDVAIRMWSRPDARHWFTVDLDDSIVRVSSRTNAEFWAAAASGQLVIDRRDTTVVSNVPLPLSMARWASHLGGQRPAFDPENGNRRYPTPNKHCADQLLGFVQEKICKENPWSTK